MALLGTQLDWSEFVRTAKPIRNQPGSQHGYIGATGLAASGGKPTMTPEQVPAVQRRMHGVIGVTPRGRRVVGVQIPDRNEIWLIDGHDDLIDVGIVTPVPGRDINVIRWKVSTPTTQTEPGTPRRYARPRAGIPLST